MFLYKNNLFRFYARELAYIASYSVYGNSVLVWWCLSQPDTDRNLGEIGISGFYRMIP